MNIKFVICIELFLMKLQTQIPLSSAENQIDYNSRVLLLGSCFSDNIGKKFEYFEFQSFQNPFGILFHPKAIENLIAKSIGQETYSEEDIFLHNERWHCFDAHSDLSHSSEGDLVEKLNEGLKTTDRQIRESTHIIITLGTSWVYRKIESDKIVSNCHKIPQSAFNKELLSSQEVLYSLNNILDKIASVNASAQITFTISPVRHLKDGFVENQRSKANLIAAVHEIINGGNASYFPSYELMMDELRDYRFYERDMVHPNQLAIDYIWEKFKTVWVSEEAYQIMGKVEEVRKGLQHRPFNSDSERHQKFMRSLEEKIIYLKQECPFMEF